MFDSGIMTGFAVLVEQSLALLRRGLRVEHGDKVEYAEHQNRRATCFEKHPSVLWI
jgi:hypothetical protein